MTIQTYYHIDRQGDLNVGDILDLELNMELQDGTNASLSPDQTEELLEEFPDGLSTHGKRYAGMMLTTSTATMTVGDTSKGMRTKAIQTLLPQGNDVRHWETTTHLYEICMELVRRAEFDEHVSRFQSFFAFETVDEAFAWADSNCEDQVTIYEVSSEGASVHDMQWLQFSTFIEALENGRHYWNGDERTETPDNEVLLEPPVVIEDVFGRYGGDT